MKLGVGLLVALVCSSVLASEPGAVAITVGAPDWLLATPAVSPLARRGHAMAYDRAQGRVVLFGGRTDSGYLGRHVGVGRERVGSEDVRHGAD